MNRHEAQVGRPHTYIIEGITHKPTYHLKIRNQRNQSNEAVVAFLYIVISVTWALCDMVTTPDIV